MARQPRTESSRIRFTDKEWSVVQQYMARCGGDSVEKAPILRQLIFIGMASVLYQQNEILPNDLIKALPMGNAIAAQAMARESQQALCVA